MKFLADFLSCYSGCVSDTNNNSPKIESCSLVQVTYLEENTACRAQKLTRRNSSSKGLWQPSLYTISENDTIKAQEGIKASTKKMKSYRPPKTNSQACYYNDLRVQAQFQTSIMALSAVTFVF
ncbi:uncharacterized protein LOC107011221 [Solanum pennellii]|uniref:Uncharacterized protein LOC107011221 n=1 Tax=Solanum pennellii TaxID=28526 RepID=A0ABM1G540_SOLPN|nr:uncharacterized protein LOC107011221 [Solanum pennellii]